MAEKHFEVTVRGQYQAIGEHTGVPTIKHYEEIFQLPSHEAALSTICKHLLSPRLKKTHADYIRFRTHELSGIKMVGYTPNTSVLQMGIDDMNIKELFDFCVLRQIMIDPFKHAKDDIFAIRAMVQKAYSEKRLAAKEKATSETGAESTEIDKLRKQNDLPPASSEPVINVNEQRITADAKAAAVNNSKQSASETTGPEADEPLPAIEPDNDLFND